MENKMKMNVTCPNCGADINIEVSECKNCKNETKQQKTARERIEALRKAGVDVGNLFAMVGANGGECIASNENGRLTILSDDDPIFHYIEEAGDIPNRKLFRRWVMAQMFHMLTYRGWRNESGFTNALKCKGYEYQWKMMVDELHAQYRMDVNGDGENFRDRNRWFHKGVAVAMCEDYINKLQQRIDSLRVRKCKGVPYKKIAGMNIFVSDIDKKLMWPLRRAMAQVEKAGSPCELYLRVADFNKRRISMAWSTPQCAEWMDAYKGSGAFFTLQNLIRFHGVRIEDEPKDVSMALLYHKAECYQGEGWRLLGFLKHVLERNHIDIEAKIASWRK